MIAGSMHRHEIGPRPVYECLQIIVCCNVILRIIKGCVCLNVRVFDIYIK